MRGMFGLCWSRLWLLLMLPRYLLIDYIDTNYPEIPGSNNVSFSSFVSFRLPSCELLLQAPCLSIFLFFNQARAHNSLSLSTH